MNWHGWSQATPEPFGFRSVLASKNLDLPEVKPSIFAVASCVKFIHICTTSFVRCYLEKILPDQRGNMRRIGQRFFTFLIGNTAQFGGDICGEFCAICRLQKSRFTPSKPSIFAIASCTKFIHICTTSFARYCLNKRK